MNDHKHYFHSGQIILLSLLFSSNALTATLFDGYSGNYDTQNLSCTQTMPNGSSYNTPEGSCCTLEEFETDPSGCPAEYSCTETTSGTASAAKPYGWFIEGVPTFWQHKVTPRDDKEYPVGCGPIAVTTLLLWYHALGYTDIGNDYYTSIGKLDWQKMAEDLASEDYLNTHYFIVGTPAGATTTNRVQRAIEDFLDSKGIENSVSHLEVSESDDSYTLASVALDRIKHSLENGRPVIIGFDSDAVDGIGNKGDDWGFVDHYAVITGVDDSRYPEVLYINLGWGASLSCSVDDEAANGVARPCPYDWHIGSGTVHLWFVNIPAGEKHIGYEVCPASFTSELTKLYSVAKNVGLTIAPELEIGDSYPTLKRLIKKTNCQVRGGEKEVDYYYEYDITRTTICTNCTGCDALTLDTADTTILLDRLSPTP